MLYKTKSYPLSLLQRTHHQVIMFPHENAIDLVTEILQNEPKFVSCWQQIRLLSSQILELEERQQRAQRSGHRPSAESLDLRLSGLEGVRSMYMEYAHRMGQAVWEKLEEAGLISE